MRYAAHETLVAPARRSAGLGRLLAGCGLVVAAFLALSFVYSSALPLVFGAESWARLRPGVVAASTPAGVLINLFTFGFLIMALALALRTVHGRGLTSLIGPLPLARAQVRRTVVALGLLYGVVMAIPLPEALSPVPNLELRTWLSFLPLALIALALQVFAEEAVFRGYLQSQLAARFSSPLVWMGLPSLLFGLLHFDPSSQGEMAWLVAAWATAFGLVAADLTARFGTLGPATALHFLNNFSALLLAAPNGQFDGLALYAYPFSLGETSAMLAMVPADLLILLCGWLAIRLALRG